MPELTEQQYATLKDLHQRYHAETTGECVSQRAYGDWLQEQYLELERQLKESRYVENKSLEYAALWEERLESANQRINQLERSLRNVLILATRELRRKQITPERNTEMWGHAIRFCREAGVEPSLLRDPTTEESCQPK